jgi:hypothetical protein
VSELRQSFDLSETDAERKRIQAEIDKLEVRLQVIKSGGVKDQQITGIVTEAPELADTALQTELERAEQQKAILADVGKFAQEQGAIRVQNAQGIAAQLDAIRQQEIAAEQAKVAGIGQSLSILSGLFAEQTAAAKIAAIAQATMNTYQGAAAALAPPPVGAGPIVGPILAGLTIAAGLRNVAQIAGVEFAEGGLVVGPGSGTSDSIPARLSNGEAVINAKSTSMFMPVLDTINRLGGGAPIMPGPQRYQFADGGLATASNMMAANSNAEAAQLLNAIQNMPAPVVSVREIVKTQNRVQAKERISRL